MRSRFHPRAPRPDEELVKILYSDDLDSFKSAVEYGEGISWTLASHPQEMLVAAVRAGAVRCATALIQGEIPFFTDVDVNERTYSDLYVLHEAALYDRPDMIELLLYYGARTDIRCDCTFIYDNVPNDTLPLHMALEALRGIHRHNEYLNDEPSIFRMLTVLCMPRLQNHLECVSMLAWKTEETEAEFLRYVKARKIFEVAVLLLVARKKMPLTVERVKSAIQKDLSCSNIPGSREMLLQLLVFEVFEKLGDVLEAYVKRDWTGVTKFQVMNDVKRFISEAGYKWYVMEDFMRGLPWIPVPKPEAQKATDVGMAHYSTSGYRWTGENAAVEKAIEKSKPKETEMNQNHEMERSSEPWACTAHAPTEIPSLSMLATVATKESRMPVGIEALDNTRNAATVAAREFHQPVGVHATATMNNANVRNLLSSKPWGSKLFSLVKRMARV